ncbi:hypothetical protein MOP88_02820 [Sphingomonas sp. WKB10]|nr:hypothetical protein [Sphingomonas sp. WKB10]
MRQTLFAALLATAVAAPAVAQGLHQYYGLAIAPDGSRTATIEAAAATTLSRCAMRPTGACCGRSIPVRPAAIRT